MLTGTAHLRQDDAMLQQKSESDDKGARNVTNSAANTDIL